MIKVIITGADGFIGQNLRLFLSERSDVEVLAFTRKDDTARLPKLLLEVDFIFHLAGTNRPQNPAEFTSGNIDLTQLICDAVVSVANVSGKKIPILFTSSSQASHASSYGLSKLGAEDVLLQASKDHDIPIYIYRLPNVFGKWCKPNYNSVVATFCYNIAHDLPIQIHDPKTALTLVYIDDVVNHFLTKMDQCVTKQPHTDECVLTPQYTLTLAELAELIQSFKESRKTLLTERVGQGFSRALYATYLSYLPKEQFAYAVPVYGDTRGTFVEMLKTPDCGQFSFFTAHPGVTRGGHYHHTKNEKFLVMQGQALFKFRHMSTGQAHELQVSGDQPQIVESIPGWTHDISNIGDTELVVMLWANEVFDRQHPDTYTALL
jgi:UDP-2-acetamido-2,6-beta-L-arabino-hexul-4-ose reductase